MVRRTTAVRRNTELARPNLALDARGVIRPSAAQSYWPVVAIVVAPLLAYANTFSAPFVFDDIAAITQNPSIEHLATALHPPSGLSVTGRPLVNLSFALNFALSGRDAWSYHALNLALHVLNALLLFGLIRLLLAGLSRRAGAGDSTGNLSAIPAVGHTHATQRADESSTGPRKESVVAFTAALLWSVHPLQTAAVTYVMQRSELLVSTCYLLALYALLRGAQCYLLNDTLPTAPEERSGQCHLIDDTSNRTRSRGWLVVSVVACALGMAAKEVMVTAPLVVLLCDRTFIAGSMRAAVTARPWYYCALAATWFVLVALLFATDGRGDSAGFSSAMHWLDYATTQLHAIVRYLQLVGWPQPLIFDYGSRLVHEPAQVAFGALVVVTLLSGILLAWRREPALAFSGIAFFALLAPTTSIVPIATQTIAEHRMYLALAVPLTLAAILVTRLPRRRAIVSACTLTLALAATTFARNRDYRTPIALWADTAHKMPLNARAHYNLAVVLLGTGAGADVNRAIDELATALRLEPLHPFASAQLGTALLAANRPTEALPHLEKTAQLRPDSAAAHHELAQALIRLGRTRDAAEELARTVRLDPKLAAAHYNLGRALAELGRYAEALAEFETAARLDPTDASARANAARLRDYLQR